MIEDIAKFIEDTEKYGRMAFKYDEPNMISWSYVRRNLEMIIEKHKNWRQNEKSNKRQENTQDQETH